MNEARQVITSLLRGRMGEAQEVPSNIAKDITAVAKSYRQDGFKVEIDRKLPTVAISARGEDILFMQGEEASQILDEVPDNVSEEDYILWIMDSAGAFNG